MTADEAPPGASSTGSCRCRRLAGARRRRLRASSPTGPTFAHAHDQEAAASGMGDGPRRRRSRPKRRHRRSACRRRTSARATTRSSAKSTPNSKGTDERPWIADRHFALAVLRPMHRALAADADRWAIGAVQRLKREAELRGRMPTPVDPVGGQRRRALPRATSRRSVRPACCAIASRRASAARSPRIDSRALCVLRESLAWHDGLADFAFAMQGLGSRPDRARRRQRATMRPPLAAAVAHGRAIAAFALSEPDAGSDVAAMTIARASRRRRLGHRRLQDLDLQRRHRRFLLRVRAHERRAGRARHLAPSSCRPTRRA